MTQQIGPEVSREALRNGWSRRTFALDVHGRHAPRSRMANVMRPCNEAITT